MHFILLHSLSVLLLNTLPFYSAALPALCSAALSPLYSAALSLLHFASLHAFILLHSSLKYAVLSVLYSAAPPALCSVALSALYSASFSALYSALFSALILLYILPFVLYLLKGSLIAPAVVIFLLLIEMILIPDC